MPPSSAATTLHDMLWREPCGVVQKAVAVAIHILVMAGMHAGAFGFSMRASASASAACSHCCAKATAASVESGHSRQLPNREPGGHQLRHRLSRRNRRWRCSGRYPARRARCRPRSGREIGGAGAAFALPHIHGDVERFVLLVFDLLDFAQPHLHCPPIRSNRLRWQWRRLVWPAGVLVRKVRSARF